MPAERRSLANFLTADIGTAPVVLYKVPANTTVKPASLYLSNKLTADIAMKVILSDPGTGIDFVLGENITIAVGHTLLFFDQECYLRANQSLLVQGSAADCSDAFLSLEVFTQ